MNFSKSESKESLFNGITAFNATLETSAHYEEKILSIEILDTKMGELLVMANEEGIAMIKFATEKKLLLKVLDFAKKLSSKIIFRENMHISILKKEMTLYNEGNLKHFSVSLFLNGTDFQKSVWQSLSKIPFGETWSYKKQAEHMGDAKKARAVAMANSKNPICIVIPCHRVIRNDGFLSGYSGGVENKQKLLALEKAVLL
ncbi:methylated-DNA--[protein]-cysteine S-methyltransferase [Frigoriflavimonas asaccharolytica]|uniref:methylated-DNA--[protein]-cysteine S-methyltransferase n=1 Tax=Frigoriflavimonas asaccharolytica TaxID=2735899 RepID=A0A8J8G6V4_9FLAO|nr:methylated-DNA--[protein]-cysteine S-methyltransferase [Frigoriflavimonas asaccharolytica]NRS92091.1 O-6-methylguanine DNA methyltransferase [Frigoriflavimonas asaccharolytica]